MAFPRPAGDVSCVCASKTDLYVPQNIVTDVKYRLTFALFYWLEAQVLPTPKGRGLYKGGTPWGLLSGMSTTAVREC